LEQGLAEVPAISAGVRSHWRNFEGDLHAELARCDAEGAARLAPNDRQRLIRALEVIESTGHPLRHWQAEAQSRAILAGAAIERRFVEVPRDELYSRAEARFEAMLKAGALEEVRAVMDVDPSLPMMKAIGVPEIAAHLRGDVDLGQAITDAKTATRKYIKRQLTWWRGQGKGWFAAT
jgi:tRNA dimethylallyltransferase